MMINKRFTQDQFINRANEIHNNFYDYSRVEYKNSKAKVCIICPTHGEFWQQANQHLRGAGCRKCGFESSTKKRTLTTESFIEKAKEIHGNRYDYSLVEYNGSEHKVVIICNKLDHGMFLQRAFCHLRGDCCPKCMIEARTGINNSRSFDTDIFIKKAQQVHGDKYDYNESKFIGSKNLIDIVCYKHGIFKQRAGSHLSGYGCFKCAHESIGKSVSLTTNQFIQKANITHHARYDYSLVEYNGSTEKVCIICPEHGEFWQNASSHLSGAGCIKCNLSKGEIAIIEYFKNNNIKFEEQYRFADCKNKYPLRFDFYLPDYNLCIEYDGIQHYIPYSFSSDQSEKIKLKNFEYQQYRDNLKNEYCINNNIRLLRIRWNQFNNIGKILKERLNV